MRVGTDKSALFAAVRYYRCSPQRITRGSNGLRTVIRRPPVCLHCRLLPLHCANDAAQINQLPGKCSGHCLVGPLPFSSPRPRRRLPCMAASSRPGVASQTLPDGRNAPARIPAATCAGRHYAAHARRTSDAQQSLHTGHASLHRNKIQNKTEGQQGAQQGAQPTGCL